MADSSRATSRLPILIVLGALFQLGIVAYFALNFDPAIGRLMPDDAFYYLQIARNISTGLGSVFSPGELTNGYHPLWMVLLVLLHRFTPGAQEFVIAVLLLSVLCNLAGAIVLGRLLHCLHYSHAQISFAVGIFLLSPWFVGLTLTGLETPLYLLCLFAFFHSLVNLNDPNARQFYRWILFGVLAGLLMLARTDAVFFTATAFAYLAIRCGRSNPIPLAAAGALAALIVLPWVLWNYVTFGSVMQQSADAMAALTHYGRENQLNLIQNPVGALSYVLTAWMMLAFRLVVAPFSGLPQYESWISDIWALDVTVLVSILMLIGIVLAATRLKRSETGGALFPFVLWGVPALLLTGFYILVRWFWQPWNMIPLLILLLVSIPLFVPVAWYRRLGYLPLLTIAVLTIYSLQFCYFYPQTGILSFARHYQEDSPVLLKIGSTDAGYLGYFSRHTVVNLDGVVNYRAYQAIMAGKLGDYVDAQKFDAVLIDPKRLRFYDRNRGPGPESGANALP